MQAMLAAALDREPCRLVIEPGRREFELDRRVVEIECQALAILRQARHGQMRHGPQRLAAQEPDTAMAAIALGIKIGAGDLALANAEPVEKPMYCVHVMHQRR